MTSQLDVSDLAVARERRDAASWTARALVAGPFAFLAGAIAWSFVGREPSNFSGMVRYFADNYSAFMASNMLRIAGSGLMVPFGAALIAVGGKGQRLRCAAGVLVAIGALLTLYNAGVDVSLATVAHRMQALGRLDSLIADIKPAANTPFVLAPIGIGQLASVLGLLLAGTSFWNHDRAGRLVPTALVAGTVVLAVGGTIGRPAIFAVGAALVAASAASLVRRLDLVSRDRVQSRRQGSA